VRGFSTNDFTIARTVTINGMGHVTDITEAPITGDLWVAGFKMSDIPDEFYGNDPIFYYPYLAKIPYGSNSNVDAVLLTETSSDPNNDIALPLSITWTGPEVLLCDGANLDGLGDVNLSDFAILALQWHGPPLAPSADIHPLPFGNDYVDGDDLEVIAEHWLRSDCTDP
jgi:hypothetical protein